LLTLIKNRIARRKKGRWTESFVHLFERRRRFAVAEEKKKSLVKKLVTLRRMREVFCIHILRRNDTRWKKLRERRGKKEKKRRKANEVSTAFSGRYTLGWGGGKNAKRSSRRGGLRSRFLKSKEKGKKEGSVVFFSAEPRIRKEGFLLNLGGRRHGARCIFAREKGGEKKKKKKAQCWVGGATT